MVTIERFTAEHRFLSNFFPSPILVRGMGTRKMFTAPTAEHVFQAFKTLDPEEQQLILECETPGQAKRAGRKVTLRKDWESIKLDAMTLTVEAKFEQNPLLADLLILTEDAELVEGNWWEDKFWGVCLKTGEGQNWLGKILMLLREEL